jgi:hypothetical protein
MADASYSSFVKIGYVVVIAVGYEDEMTSTLIPAGISELWTTSKGIPLQLFLGTVRFCRRYKDKADWIVEITADGGNWDIAGQYINMGFQAGCTVYSLLASLASQLQVPIRNLQDVLQAAPGASYANGFSFFGTVWLFLTMVCGRINFDFAIDGGVITLYRPEGLTAPFVTGVSLSKETGLLKPPEPQQINIGLPSDQAVGQDVSNTRSDTRWKMTSLLLPQVGPGDVMFVTSNTLAVGAAYFQVEDIEYVADNRAGDFHMEATCIPVDSQGAQVAVQVR